MKHVIYPGSFDPITLGHINIIERAAKIFPKVTISVIENPSKNATFSIQERIELIKEIFKDRPNIDTEYFQGLLMDYAENKGVETIIRGLRAFSDFDFEFQMALTNRELNPNIDTVFLMTDVKRAYVSSSIVKEVALLNGDVSSFVPKIVETALQKKFTKG
ncbi:pantetheine-phosphate adenylyltransferase [bacterium]|mgnify:FL=1|jgi:pantetheine-phosphate adenylyltransferase|nr:pantetheine-phosphate adenylyltransferase [bacterium]